MERRVIKTGWVFLNRLHMLSWGFIWALLLTVDVNDNQCRILLFCCYRNTIHFYIRELALFSFSLQPAIAITT